MNATLMKFLEEHPDMHLFVVQMFKLVLRHFYQFDIKWVDFNFKFDPFGHESQESYLVAS